MTSAPGSLPLREVGRLYQRVALIAFGVGAAALVVAALMGHVGVGMLLCVGLGLGAANAAVVHLPAVRQSIRDSARDRPDRRRLATGVLVRLGVVAVIAVFFGLAFRPEGLAVIAGLAVFQLIMLAAATTALRRALGDAPRV